MFFMLFPMRILQLGLNHVIDEQNSRFEVDWKLAERCRRGLGRQRRGIMWLSDCTSGSYQERAYPHVLAQCQIGFIVHSCAGRKKHLEFVKADPGWCRAVGLPDRYGEPSAASAVCVITSCDRPRLGYAATTPPRSRLQQGSIWNKRDGSPVRRRLAR